MELNRWLLPAAWFVCAAAISVGRFVPSVAWAGVFLGSALALIQFRVQDRALGLAAVLPVAAWVAGLAPFGGIVAAAIVAVPFAFLLEDVPAMQWSSGALGMTVLGGVVAALGGILMVRFGDIEGLGDLLGLMVAVATFRIAVTSLGQRHWGYGLAVAVCVVPYLGTTGLFIALAEAGFGLMTMAAAPPQRLAGTLGAVGVLLAQFA